MKYFGTDGIRDKAERLIKDDLPLLLGRALACAKNGAENDCAVRVCVAKDVRLSSDEIEERFLKGLLEHGAEVFLCGVMTTPALVAVANTLNVDYSVMITASHNPPQYNGLKVFEGNGGKLPPDDEEALDAALDFAPEGKKAGKVHVVENAEQIYVKFLTDCVGERLDGFKVRLDCGNGCTAEIAKKVFSALGAEVEADNDVRDGSVVNVGTGATNVGFLLSRLRPDEIGFSFDGDGDRVIGAAYQAEDARTSRASEDGSFGVIGATYQIENDKNNTYSGDALNGKAIVLDGDYFLLSLAELFRKDGLLANGAVVATILSNSKLDVEMQRRGIALTRAKVGDKFVLDAMKETGAALGGEQSGHIITLPYLNTGDGILSALLLLKARKRGIAPDYRPLPQYSFNFRNNGKQSLLFDKQFTEEIENIRQLIGNEGRILVRESGTEPVIRVMCETDKKFAVEKLTYLENIFNSKDGF